MCASWLGTRIGGGPKLDGKLHLRHTRRGAELGHISVDVNSHRGTAGVVGTLENICGRDAIVWRALRALNSGHASSIPEFCLDLTQLTPRLIADAAAAGAELVKAVWDETAHYLAVGIMNVIVLTDVGRIVIGGGVAQAREVLLLRCARPRSAYVIKAGVIGAAQGDRISVL
jgi:glucokinase